MKRLDRIENTVWNKVRRFAFYVVLKRCSLTVEGLVTSRTGLSYWNRNSLDEVTLIDNQSSSVENIPSVKEESASYIRANSDTIESGV
jgi:hypothetical protein